jgi:hypothetical protein
VTNASIRQTGLNLVCDYRFVLVPLLKSHMQECLHNQVYEDAFVDAQFPIDDVAR